ncbi:hypothetical protein CHS0354_031019 [Potamilus streckersoni]|uniref:Targeting protein for Xklp2 n=1 Tax=Potamilus streckersoni TaxID=2493646 RepID=A0AAE0TE50_9BIVA|nr:hypothetical protein CHS0354_031019 [Potamilus streckersoni]
MADPNWEFNCPQYVDFSKDNIYADDDGADNYFDFDHENGIPINFSDSATTEHEPMDVDAGPSESLVKTLQNDSQRITRAMAKNSPKIIESPRRIPTLAEEQKKRTSKSSSRTPSVVAGEESNERESQKITYSQTKDTPKQTEINHDSEKSGEEEKKVSNMCTDLEEWNKRKQEQRVETGQKRRRSISFSELEPNHNTRANKPLQRSGSMKAQRRSADQSSGGSSRHDSREVGRPRSGSESKIARPSPKRYKCTMPSTPTFMKRQPLIPANGVKRSEDLELEKIQYFRTQLQQKRELAQKSMKVALSHAPAQEAHHAAKEPTKPVEFQFETDKRVKKHGMETRADVSVKDFAQQLRSNQAAQKEGPKGPTKPMPFSFDEKQKRKLDGSEEILTQKFESMAEKVTAFHKATPERFRSAPKGSAPKRGRSKSPPVLTVPHTPNLETRSRSRPVTVPSQKELEEMEIEEMKKYQFRAHPLNTKIFTEQPCIKHSEKEPTRPEEFDLHTDRRIQTRETVKQDTEEHYEFHAQPVPKKILEGPVGLKPAKPLPVTNPKSPAFVLKHRARLPTRSQPEPEEEEKIIKANPVPHAGIPFQPSLEHKATVPQPFTFDERDKLMMQKKEEKIQEILEEEKRARDFVANPLPNLSPDVLPPKKVKPPTRPESPHLKIDARGAKRAAEWKAKVEEQLNKEREAAIFKALPSTVVHKDPFVPKKSSKVLTEVSNVELSTVKRAMQREAFDMHRKAQEAELEAAKRQREMEKEEEEREAIEKLRQEAVHKANPIKRYKPVDVKRSSKPCTVPLSPKFKTDERLQLSRNHNLSNA